MNIFYKPSGRISFSSIIYFSVLTVLFIPLFSYLYSLTIWNIQFIYIKFIITIIFSVLIAFVSRIVILKGKVRNKSVAFFLAFTMSMVGIYLHWSSWISLFAFDVGIDLPKIYPEDDSVLSIFNIFSSSFYPIEFLNSIKIIVHNGVWEFNNSVIRDELYWFFILLETGIILYTPITWALEQAKEPFCEISNEWMEEIELPKFKVINHKKILSPISRGDYNFNGIELSTRRSISHSLITIYASHFNYYLKLENKIKSRNPINLSEHKIYLVIDNLKIEKKLTSNDFINDNRPKNNDTEEVIEKLL